MTDTERREVDTAFVRRHYATGPTAYDTTTGNPLRWPTPADVAYCEQQFDRWLAALVRAACATAWDAAVWSMRYEDGTPVELVTNINPYREGDPT